MNKLPRVVIVGRMNVGKSTLFNRLSVDVKSLTLDVAGLTRDIVKDVVSFQDYAFELIDTGGFTLRKTQDALLDKVRTVALQAIESAAVVLLVIDGTVGVVQEERELAALLHKMKKHVIVVVNKLDSGKSLEHQHEARTLGFSEVAAVSAQHGTQVYELLESIVAHFPKKQAHEEEDTSFRVAFIGKPNVGKSSLMNCLLKHERSIVSEVAGTTREAISENITFYQEHIQLTDTPGLRRKRGIKEEVEQLMVKSSLQALKDTHLVVLLVDGSEEKLVDQELKLAFYSFTEQYKGLVILVNKSDLLTDEMKERLEYSMQQYPHLLDKVPVMHISCKTGKNIGRLLPLFKEVSERYKQRFDELELARLFMAELKSKPQFHHKQPLRLYFVRQIRTAPITILLEVNQPEWFGPAEIGFFDNLLRKHYDLIGVPVKFVIQKSK